MEMKEGNGGGDRRADSSGGRFVYLERKLNRGGTTPVAAEFDGWVVDFTGCEFPESTADAKNENFGSSETVPEALEKDAGTSRGGHRRRRAVPLCLLSIFVAACLGAVWIAFFDTYTAETKLLFISPVASSPNQGSWNVEQEAEILKSSALAHKVHYAGTGQTGGSVPVTQVSGPATMPPHPRVGSAVGNADELLDGLSFQVARWDGGGCVTIAVRGDDPRYLKSILTSYTRQYLQSRHELVTLAAISHGPTRPGGGFSGNRDFVSALDGELARMELMKRNCALALTLMDKKAGKKKGSLNGFLPSGLGSELTSLNRINDELVNLFIKRQHLATRFNPASREIGELNQQIEGLRKMLRRHLQQQVTFLQSGMEQLQARKQEIQGRTRPASGDSEVRKRNILCGDGPAPGEWIPVSSDVVIMPGRPIVVKRPVRERLMSFIDRSVDLLLDRRNKPSPTDGPNGAASRLACTTTLFEDPRYTHESPREILPEKWSQGSSRKHDPSAVALK